MITMRSQLILTLVLIGFIFSNVLQLNSQEIVDAEAIPLIPRTAFFSQDPDMAVKISPNGKQISFLKPYEGVLNVWVQNIGDKQEAFPVTKSKDPIFHYRWAKNNEQILYFRDSEGDENSHIYSVDLKSSKIIDLTPFDNVQARIVRGSEKYPDEMSWPLTTEILHITIYGQSTPAQENGVLFMKIRKNLENYLSIIIISFASVEKAMAKVDISFLFEILRTRSWKPFIHFDKDDNSITSRILEFSSDNQRLYYLDSTNSNTAALYSSQCRFRQLAKRKDCFQREKRYRGCHFRPKYKKATSRY